MQVEETEFYRTRNGNVLGPFTHKPHIGWIVPGLRVSWDNDGRLRRSTIEEERAISSHRQPSSRHRSRRWKNGPAR